MAGMLGENQHDLPNEAVNVAETVDIEALCGVFLAPLSSPRACACSSTITCSKEKL